MFTKTKRHLLYFETDGNIIPDFTASRLKKSAKLRRVIHFCFYAQCVAAISCAVVGVGLSADLFSRIFAVAAAVCVIVVAFFALGGHSGEKTASYILNLVYAVIAFFIGDMAMYFCGGLLLLAALGALVSYFAGYFRDWLMGYSPFLLRSGIDYKLNKKPQAEEHKEELPPSPPEKSELMEVAEAFMGILK